MTTPNLGMPELVGGQVDGHVTHNEALALLDVLVQAAVLDRDLNVAPAASNGDRYIVATGVSSGDPWFGKAGQIAFRISDEWRFAAPAAGWRVWVEDEQLYVQWIVGVGWRSVTGDAIFAARRATSAQVISASWDGLELNSQTWIDDGVYAHSTSVSPDEITLNEAGRYLVEADVAFEATSGAGWTAVETRFTLQGGEVSGSLGIGRVEVSNVNKLTLHTHMVITAAAGNILKIEAQKTGAATVEITQGYTRVTVRKLSA